MSGYVMITQISVLEYQERRLCVCPYRCTFADPRQMEDMCSSVDCVCFSP